jgi:predicted RNA-binding Zn ribbon-like protein
MASTHKRRSRVRAVEWGFAPDRPFLEEFAEQLNDEGVARNRWLQVSERQIDPAVTDRLGKIRFGSIQARAAMRVDLARKYGAICATRVILEPSMPLAPFPARLAEQTITKFRRLGARHPAQLDLRNVTRLGLPDPERKEVGHPLVAVPVEAVTIQSHGDDPCGTALARIWRLIGLRERDRLKRCPGCGTWFVDPTRPKRKISCGPRCHNARRWSRAARRAAGHTQYRPRGRRKRRPMR